MKKSRQNFSSENKLSEYISTAGKLTNYAFFDKSSNFDTEVDQYIMNKFGCGAIT